MDGPSSTTASPFLQELHGNTTQSRTPRSASTTKHLGFLEQPRPKTQGGTRRGGVASAQRPLSCPREARGRDVPAARTQTVKYGI